MDNKPLAELEREGVVVCRLPGRRRPAWGVFDNPLEILATAQMEMVPGLVARVEEASRRGFYVAGFLAYEAAAAFDPAHAVKPLRDFPLAWFGVYGRPPKPFKPINAAETAAPMPPLTPEMAAEAHRAAVLKIKDYIAAGDIYQANLTFRMRGEWPESGAALFLRLFASHPAPYAAYVDTGAFRLVSLSPELFLERRGDLLLTAPMKGTAPRAPDWRGDRAAVRSLAACPKNRAENLMIVDMARNDLGRVCRYGSVRVDPLFRVETYATVHQLVSHVHGVCRPGVSLFDLWRATFPAASITGAPKIRAMEVIDEMEGSPRLAYTGAIGCLTPSGDMTFNVAIRTLVGPPGGAAELGVGGGIVADSRTDSEWEECLLKARFVEPRPRFSLIETMLRRRDGEIPLLAAHLLRLGRSQRYFRRPWRPRLVAAALAALPPGGGDEKIRMLLDANGAPTIERHPAPPRWERRGLRLLLVTEKTNSNDVFLHHKTTRRAVYDECFRRAVAAGFDDALFRNERGEITEGAISNIFIKAGGRWLTPPLSAGVLPGVWRAAKIRELRATEAHLDFATLATAEEVIAGNSLRGAGRVERLETGSNQETC